MPKTAVEEKRFQAFTLVELMITAVIIGILATTAIIKYGPVAEKARSAEAYSVLARIASAENVYRLENSAYTNNIGSTTPLDIDPPTSQNFTFDVTSTNLTTGYVSAIGIVGRATKSYGMCLRTGETAVYAVNSACNPGC